MMQQTKLRQFKVIQGNWFSQKNMKQTLAKRLTQHIKNCSSKLLYYLRSQHKWKKKIFGTIIISMYCT